MVAGLYFFVVHSLTRRDAIVDLRLMRDRNYALGMVLVFLYGLLTLAPMVLMPPFLKDLQDYPMATIGLLLSPRGLGLFMAMILLGRLGHRLDPRLQIASGFVLLAVSSWWMSGWNLEVTAGPVFWTGLMQGLGAGSIIGPLGLLTFASIAAEHRTEAASMWNLIRSLGSSIGIATALAILVRTAGISHGVLAEAISPFNEMLRESSAVRRQRVDRPVGAARAGGRGRAPGADDRLRRRVLSVRHHLGPGDAADSAAAHRRPREVTQAASASAACFSLRSAPMQPVTVSRHA